jgi:hypothetical protein
MTLSPGTWSITSAVILEPSKDIYYVDEKDQKIDLFEQV